MIALKKNFYNYFISSPVNTVNQTTSAKVVVSKLPDIIDGTSAGLTLTEAMLDAKLQGKYNCSINVIK